MVFVTHDLASVERFCDRVVLLEQGVVAAEGEPHEVIMDYRQRDLESAQTRHSTAGTGARWGDAAAEITDMWFEDESGRRVETVPHGTSVSFQMDVAFNADMENPLFGVIFKGDEGETVWATNTLWDRMVTGNFKAGERARFSIAFPMLLADGVYRASPAVSHQDAQRIADWREDACELRVRGEVHSGGYVDLPHESRLSRGTTPEPAADGAAGSRAGGTISRTSPGPGGH